MSADLLLGDVALTIISLLEAKDVCALGTCSSFCRAMCFSDPVWQELIRRRWPHVDIAPLFRSMFVGSAGLHPPPEVKIGLYIESHKVVAHETSSAIHEITQCAPHSSFEVTKYLSVVKKLSALYLGFEDVQLFLFRPKLGVVVNLIGVHYSILYLCVPPEEVLEALIKCQVASRQVRLSCLKIGRWFHGFRLLDENHIRKVSLAELATSKELPILVMINRTNDTFWIQGQNGSHFEPKPVPPPLPNKCDWEIEPSELDFSSSTVIGKGSFGEILRAYWRGTPVAVKHTLPSLSDDRLVT